MVQPRSYSEARCLCLLPTVSLIKTGWTLFPSTPIKETPYLAHELVAQRCTDNARLQDAGYEVALQHYFGDWTVTLSRLAHPWGPINSS